MRALPFSLVAALYLCLYALLAGLSFVHPAGSFGITPWNPSAGLSFLLVLVYGRRALPLLFVAPLLTEIFVRHLPVPASVAIIGATAIGGGYTLATLFLLRPKTAFDPGLGSLRDIYLLVATAIGSSALVALAYVGLLVAGSVLPASRFIPTALNYWVGELIGIAVVTPFGLLAAKHRSMIAIDWRMAAQIACLGIVLAIMAVAPAGGRLPLFYLLFLPITWIAATSGLKGVSLALILTQGGLFAALRFMPVPAAEVTDLQARMFILAVTGLVAGALVTERRRAEEELRRNEAAVARLSRLGSMGELAAAIAHEVKQPLSAAGTYARLVCESLAGEELKDPETADIAKKAAAQTERAAEVIDHLRALVRMGRSDLSPVRIASVIEESLDLVRPVLARGNIAMSVEMEESLPPVMADRIQIEQVLINLLRNAAEAIASSAASQRRISVKALQASAGLLEITINDTGPGLPASFPGATLFSSSKADGLGIGLYLCRLIAEAHGGTFQLISTDKGATARLTLRFAEGFANEGQDQSCTHR